MGARNGPPGLSLDRAMDKIDSIKTESDDELKSNYSIAENGPCRNSV